MNKTVMDLLKKYDDAVEEFSKFPKGRTTGPGKKLYDKMIAAKRAYEKAAGIQEPETPLGPRLAKSFQKFLGVGEKGGLNVGPSTTAFIQEKAAREYLTKLVKQQDLDDLEDALQVQESKRFKGYKDPTITVPKRKEAVPVREDQEQAVDNQYPHDPWYRKDQYPTGIGSFSTGESEPTTSPDFDRDKDIFHQIAYGISKLTGQEPSVTYDYPGDREDLRDLKKGGKVKKKKKSKKKYTSKKKYSMNRGGVASVRKPTRA